MNDTILLENRAYRTLRALSYSEVNREESQSRFNADVHGVRVQDLTSSY